VYNWNYTSTTLKVQSWKEITSVVRGQKRLNTASLQHVLSLFILLCLHQCYLLPPSLSDWLATASQLSKYSSLCLLKTQINSRLKLKLIYDWRSVGQSVLVSGSHLETMTRFFCLSDDCGFLDVGALSLTRGWVCNLLVQLLLGLARAVTLGSKSRRNHDHILLSHLRLPQLGGL
jgi:hypothetical protein